MEKELLTSFIAAGSAVFGVAASQLGGIVRSVFDKRKERSELLRTKLEELTDNLHKSPEWFDLLLRSLPVNDVPRKTSNADLQSLPLPIESRRVYVLSLLYFPALRKDAQSLLNSAYSFHSLVVSYTLADPEKMQDVVSKFGEAKATLDKLIIVEAEKIGE